MRKGGNNNVFELKLIIVTLSICSKHPKTLLEMCVFGLVSYHQQRATTLTWFVTIRYPGKPMTSRVIFEKDHTHPINICESSVKREVRNLCHRIRTFPAPFNSCMHIEAVQRKTVQRPVSDGSKLL